MKYIILISLLFLPACAMTPIEQRQQNVLTCVKDLKSTSDTAVGEGFEVCRQIYGLRKLKEAQ